MLLYYPPSPSAQQLPTPTYELPSLSLHSSIPSSSSSDSSNSSSCSSSPLLSSSTVTPSPTPSPSPPSSPKSTPSLSPPPNASTDDNTTSSTEKPKIRKRVRPPKSYVLLISEAILESKNRMLTLRELYYAIMNKFPEVYNLSDLGWQNTIRYNLSRNHCFQKISRSVVQSSSPSLCQLPGDPKIKAKGGYWTVRKEYLPYFERGIFNIELSGTSANQRSTSSSTVCQSTENGELTASMGNNDPSSAMMCLASVAVGDSPSLNTGGGLRYGTCGSPSVPQQTQSGYITPTLGLYFTPSIVNQTVSMGNHRSTGIYTCAVNTHIASSSSKRLPPLLPAQPRPNMIQLSPGTSHQYTTFNHIQFAQVQSFQSNSSPSHQNYYTYSPTIPSSSRNQLPSISQIQQPPSTLPTLSSPKPTPMSSSLPPLKINHPSPKIWHPYPSPLSTPRSSPTPSPSPSYEIGLPGINNVNVNSSNPVVARSGGVGSSQSEEISENTCRTESEESGSTKDRIKICNLLN
ncbi:hypothetical protein BKA69DRAFT_1134676 [Paraphysoderma sedebokerense]|nr:hypothetical protein BKA69DRAFT_1134676 [Paraphysoderma sedebokerense]